jgi:hypothetical protein
MIPEMSGGRTVFPMNLGVTSVAATDFSSNICTLKISPTSTAGEKQVTGAIVTVTPGADGDNLVLPPVGQSKGLMLIIVNLHDSHHMDIQYVNSSGSRAELFLGNSDLEDEEIAIAVCDGVYWYNANALST